MDDAPWALDTVSLVEAYRSGEHSPVAEVEAVLAAIDASDLNATSYVDADAARQAAAGADVSLPFGGVAILVKQGQKVRGWPATEGSVALSDLVHDDDATLVARLREAGAILVGQSTQSEFAGLHQTRTKLYGATRNPWDLGRTPGGSSGGAAAAVAGGVVTLATAGDGGGSTRIPASFCGLPGLKPTYGRIPRGPHLALANLVAAPGCLSRSVRDIARFLDVVNGFDPRDPYSLPRVDGWERDLGTSTLRGLRVAISPNLGIAVVRRGVRDLVLEHAELLVQDAGLDAVDVDIAVPEGSYEWAMAGMARIREQLGDRWPACADELTPPIRFGLDLAAKTVDLDLMSRIEAQRTEGNERMAAIFDQVDLVIGAVTPDVAFEADGRLPEEVDGERVAMGNNGALTIASNLYGNPAISIPIGTVDGLPVGLQVLAAHHREHLLLDLAALVEANRPWPLVAPLPGPAT
jgi:Asp-tRNA(Asn)/Glu-tRNA(Gln) amidotransferase A subunit family amidase